MRVRVLLPTPIVLRYAGIRYELKLHPQYNYVALFFGEEGGHHFKVSDTFQSVEKAKQALWDGFEAHLHGPVQTVFSELMEARLVCRTSEPTLPLAGLDIEGPAGLCGTSPGGDENDS